MSNPEHGPSPSKPIDAIENPVVGHRGLRFDRELVWFDDVGAYQGADHHRHLGTPEFYEAVGRPDLATKEQTSRRSATILVATGGALVLGGALWLIGDVLANAFTASAAAGPCLLSEVSAGMPCQRRDLVDAAPIVTAAAGGLIMLAGAATFPRPPTPEDARNLAKQHNRALLDGPQPSDPSIARETVGSLRMAPTLTADGVGMAVAGTF